VNQTVTHKLKDVNQKDVVRITTSNLLMHVFNFHKSLYTLVNVQSFLVWTVAGCVIHFHKRQHEEVFKQQS